MNQAKSIFKSKTFWGIIVAALPQLLPLLGVAAGPAGMIVSLAGSALGIYGRLTADTTTYVVPPADTGSKQMD